MKLGVCYYPEHWRKEEWSKDIKKMKEIGISVVRIFEFTWGMVEKKEGIYDFSLCNEFLDLLRQSGLTAIMCTPTAAPPPWLLKKYPEVRRYFAPNEPLRSGTRKTYSFASKKYRELAKKIVSQFVINFKEYRDVIIGWQTDNEYGFPVVDYSPINLEGFRRWLERRYNTIDNLNKAWGSEFWSLIYGSFDEIEFSAQRSPNPSQGVDYYRYQSELATEFNREQVKIIKDYFSDCPVTHNFMGTFPYVNQYDLSEDLDVPSLDFYPLGNYSNSLAEGREELRENTQLRRGKYFAQGLSFDLTRSVGKGKFWILEHQVGAINWGKYNPIPQDGMINLWGLEAICHGVKLLSPFRWRQCLVGFESFHSGLLLPNGEIGQGGREYKQISKDVEKLQKEGFFAKENELSSKVAMIYDYDSIWAYIVQPQSIKIDNLNLFNHFYKLFTDMSVNVDIISPSYDLSSYETIVLTHSMIYTQEFINKLKSFQGKIILTPRTFSRDINIHIPEDLAPHGLEELLDVKVEQIETFPNEFNETIEYRGKTYNSSIYREHITTQHEVLATFNEPFRQGMPAIVKNNNVVYIACVPEQVMLEQLLVDIDVLEKFDNRNKSEDVKIKVINNFIFIFNYSKDTFDSSKYLPNNFKIVIGENHYVRSSSVLVVKIL